MTAFKKPTLESSPPRGAGAPTRGQPLTPARAAGRTAHGWPLAEGRRARVPPDWRAPRDPPATHGPSSPCHTRYRGTAPRICRQVYRKTPIRRLLSRGNPLPYTTFDRFFPLRTAWQTPPSTWAVDASLFSCMWYRRFVRRTIHPSGSRLLEQVLPCRLLDLLDVGRLCLSACRTGVGRTCNTRAVSRMPLACIAPCRRSVA